MNAARIRQGTAAGHGRGHAWAKPKSGIISFPLPDYAVADADARPRCAWCGDPFTPTRPNRRYCSDYHKRLACACRKAALVEAVARLLEAHGAQTATARTKAADVVETYYQPPRPGTDGRVTRAMKALGYWYDERRRVWERDVR